MFFGFFFVKSFSTSPRNFFVKSFLASNCCINAEKWINHLEGQGVMFTLPQSQLSKNPTSKFEKKSVIDHLFFNKEKAPLSIVELRNYIGGACLNTTMDK